MPTSGQICGCSFFLRVQAKLTQPGRITLDKGARFKIR